MILLNYEFQNPSTRNIVLSRTIQFKASQSMHVGVLWGTHYSDPGVDMMGLFSIGNSARTFLLRLFAYQFCTLLSSTDHILKGDGPLCSNPYIHITFSALSRHWPRLHTQLENYTIKLIMCSKYNRLFQT